MFSISVDLDDTGNCPQDTSCISCRWVEDLMVVTVGSPVGVFCVTMCATCTNAGETPHFAPVSAVRACLEHCAHLGITADDMEAIMEGEGR